MHEIVCVLCGNVGPVYGGTSICRDCELKLDDDEDDDAD